MAGILPGDEAICNWKRPVVLTNALELCEIDGR
jgi:hypothetical protein